MDHPDGYLRHLGWFEQQGFAVDWVNHNQRLTATYGEGAGYNMSTNYGNIHVGRLSRNMCIPTDQHVQLQTVQRQLRMTPLADENDVHFIMTACDVRDFMANQLIRRSCKFGSRRRCCTSRRASISLGSQACWPSTLSRPQGAQACIEPNFTAA